MKKFRVFIVVSLLVMAGSYLKAECRADNGFCGGWWTNDYYSICVNVGSTGPACICGHHKLCDNESFNG